MDYLLYLMYRCDRRCDRCDGKFGNLVGTKHTQGKLGKAVICVFIDVLSTCTFDKCKHLQLYCFWEIEAMHYILVEYVKLADFASSFWCSVFFRSLLFWFSSEGTSAVLIFSLSIRLSLLWMVICLTFYPGCSCAQLMDGKLFNVYLYIVNKLFSGVNKFGYIRILWISNSCDLYTKDIQKWWLHFTCSESQFVVVNCLFGVQTRNTKLSNCLMPARMPDCSCFRLQ